ncbi:MAG: DNA translocase FtsK [Muribaculaceae bacterium]|nr:DNA translocase FtsK [Muribaculaceae bacterium]
MGGTHGFYVNWLVLQYADILGVYALTALLSGLLVAVYLNPIKSFFSLAGSMMPRRKAAPEPVSESEAGDEPEAPSVLDGLDVSDAADETETEPHHESAPEEIDDSADAGDHSRFMPPVGLDDLDKKDDDELESDPDEEDAEQYETAETPAESAEASDEVRTDIQDSADTPVQVRLASAPGDPEMVIKNTQPEKASDTDHAAIRNGDHIGLDTPYDVRASHSSYQFPSTELLIERGKTVEVNEAEQLANKKLIVDALRSYNIDIQRIEATIGPTVTLYEIVPAQGTRIAKIKSLEDDIAMSLSALGIRIIAPIPGKGTVGIEVPNRKPQIVSMRTVLESRAFAENRMQLPMALGATISNDIYMSDLAKMPHLLVAGATGQGKSVGLNCIITSLLYSKHPDELKFVLVDPKTVEFSLFETISRQYLAKLPDEEKAVITDPQKVIATLNSLCVEMDSRYALLSDARVRNIVEYNSRFTERQLNPEKGHRFLPYIVVIVDEYADLVMVAGKDVAAPICRIAQKARAVGIHMIIATQRPSTDIITGMIKANFTARIAFKVTQGVDSKTILDRPGAQRLIGRGDMLTMMSGTVERVQCAFIDTPEVEAVCEHIGRQPGFTSCYLLPEPPAEDGGESQAADFGAVTEEFKRCALFISSQSQASITSLQRKFEIGFNKAGRFMDQMQQMGIVGPAKGAKPRDVLMTPDEVQRLFE